MASSSFALDIEGLVLHENVVSQEEQAELVTAVDKWLEVGRKGLLPGKTYAPVPLSWAAAGQSREMLQFGAYTHSNRLELSTKVAVLPPILLNLLRRIVASGQLPWPYPPPVPQAKASADDEVSNAHASGNSSVESQPNVDKSAENSGGSHASASDASSAAADSSFEGVSSWCCTVNCYSPGQWIPPHIDNPKFARPFATLSLLSTQDTSFAPLPPPTPPPVPQACNASESSGVPDNEAPTAPSAPSTTPSAATTMEIVTESETASASPPEVVADGGSAVSEASPNVHTFKEAPGALRLPLRPGSLLVVGGASADQWTHAVPPVSERRISLTFRRLDPTVAAAAAAQAAAVAAAYATKGEMKRRAKQAAKEAKQALKREKQMFAAAALLGEASSTEGGGVGTSSSSSSSSGAKSTPVPAQMLRQLTALPQSLTQAETTNNDDFSNHEAPDSEMVTDSSNLPRSDEDSVSVVRRPLIELNHVMRLYDAIAPQWHGTRYRSWPKVDAFIANLPPGSLVCDAGCGNGKNLPACNAYRPATDGSCRSGKGAIEEGGAEVLGGDEKGAAEQLSQHQPRRGWGLGSDFSSELVKIVAVERGMDGLVADSLALPYRTGCFGACLSIAVLHHISSPPRRRRLMFECLRVVEVGGCALFYAWAQDQETGFSGHEFVDQDVLVPFHLRAPAPSSKAKNAETIADEPRKCAPSAVDTTPAQPPRVNKRRLSPSSSDARSHNGGDSSSSTSGSSSSSNTGVGTTNSSRDKSIDGSEAEAEASAAEGLAEYNAAKGSLVFQRYCHVYRPGELTELANGLNSNLHPWVEVKEEYYDTGNWCLIARKISETPCV